MNQKSIIESLLFTSGHPLSQKKMAEILGILESDVEKSLKELAVDYEQNSRGLRLVFF